MKTGKLANVLATLATLLAGAPVALAAPGSIEGHAQATGDDGLLDLTGGFAILCDGPGLTCKEVARRPLTQKMSADGPSAPYSFPNQSRAHKVRVWKDMNGNGTVDAGDLEGWYREGAGDPVAVEPGAPPAHVTAHMVGSLAWKETNGVGMGRITGAIALPAPAPDGDPDFGVANQTRIVACVQTKGACDGKQTFFGWIEDFDGDGGTYVIEAPTGVAYTVFAWIDADGDDKPGGGEAAAVIGKPVTAPAKNAGLRLRSSGAERLPAMSDRSDD